MQPKTPVAREEDSTCSQVPSSKAFVQQDLRTLKLFQPIMPPRYKLRRGSFLDRCRPKRLMRNQAVRGPRHAN